MNCWKYYSNNFVYFCKPKYTHTHIHSHRVLWKIIFYCILRKTNVSVCNENVTHKVSESILPSTNSSHPTQCLMSFIYINKHKIRCNVI